MIEKRDWRYLEIHALFTIFNFNIFFCFSVNFDTMMEELNIDSFT